METTPHQELEGRAVCQVLAMVLERLVEASSNFEQDDSQVTKFHALRAPAIGICQYLERINKLIQRNNFVLTELNVHRVVITAVLLAAKFFDDAYYNNAYYAKVGGVLVSEMNSLEVEFLFRINFNLRVVPEVYQKYHAELVSHASTMGLRIEPCSTDPSVLGLMAPQPKIQLHYPTPEIPQAMLSLDCPVVDSSFRHHVPVIPPSAAYQQPTANHYNNGSTISHHHSLSPSQITPSPPQWKPANGSEAGWNDRDGSIMYHHILSQHLPGSSELAIEMQQQLLLSQGAKGQGTIPAQQLGNMPPFPQLPVTTTPFTAACSPAYYTQVPDNLNQSKSCYTSQQHHSSSMMHKNCADLIGNDVGMAWQQPPDVTTSYNGHHYFVASPTAEFPINNSPQIRS